MLLVNVHSSAQFANLPVLEIFEQLKVPEQQARSLSVLAQLFLQDNQVVAPEEIPGHRPSSREQPIEYRRLCYNILGEYTVPRATARKPSNTSG